MQCSDDTIGNRTVPLWLVAQCLNQLRHRVNSENLLYIKIPRSSNNKIMAVIMYYYCYFVFCCFLCLCNVFVLFYNWPLYSQVRRFTRIMMKMMSSSWWRWWWWRRRRRWSGSGVAGGGGGGGGGVRRFKLVTLTRWPSSPVTWISVISIVVRSPTDFFVLWLLHCHLTLYCFFVPLPSVTPCFMVVHL